MKKKIIVIGGGIAGLTAGIYAQQRGFDSVVYEKHTIVGGQCTGWSRQGCFIDGCIHWLTGSAPGSDLNDIWRNIGALGDAIKIIQHDNFGVYELDGVRITLWQDIDRLERELLEISPEDEKLIRQMIKDCKALQTMEMPTTPLDMLPLKELAELGKSMSGAGEVMKRMGKLTCEEYGKQYKHPALQKLFEACMPGGYSISAFLFSLATFCSGSGGVPEGGSLAFAQRMAERYKALGGKLVTGVFAKEILIRGKKAEAVLLSDGTREACDYVIAACDVKHTFDTLLKGKYHDSEFDKRFENTEIYKLPTSVMIAFKVHADIRELPQSLIFESAPLTVGATEIRYCGYKNYAFEPSFAPEGEAVITVSLLQTDKDFAVWEKLAKNPDEYEKEKERLAREVQLRVEEHCPELAGKLEWLDTATPMTYNRYTNAYHGAWMSFMMTPKAKNMMHKGIIRGLENVFLAGMWLQPPGGLPVAAATGKQAIHRICKKEKMEYRF